MNDKPRIGWIGVGLMGHGAAKHVLAAGYLLMVKGNRNRIPIDDLCKRGATEADSLAAIVRDCDVVFACLPSTAVVEAVVFSADGVLNGARDGFTFVDCTTSEPDSTLKIAEALAARGARMLDAPFSRTPKEAEEGRLNCMVGGERALFNSLRPVLDAFCENAFYIGPQGAGHQLKLFNNLLSMCNTALVAEATAAAAKLGIDLQMFFDVISVGGGDSRAFRAMLPWALEGDGSLFQAALSIGAKDLDIFIRTAESGGAPATMARAAKQLFELATERGHGERHMPCLAEVLAAESGAHVRDL